MFYQFLNICSIHVHSLYLSSLYVYEVKFAVHRVEVDSNSILQAFP